MGTKKTYFIMLRGPEKGLLTNLIGAIRHPRLVQSRDRCSARAFSIVSEASQHGLNCCLRTQTHRFVLLLWRRGAARSEGAVGR